MISPPPLPKNVFFESRTRCNGRCKFCPASVGNDPRKDNIMPEETFRKVIDELAELNFNGLVGLWNNNEPLLDKRIVKFVKYASEKLPDANIAITTNGILLTPELGRKLLDAGLKTLHVDNYSDECIVRKNIKEFMDKVAKDFPDRTIILKERFESEKLKNLAGWSPNKRGPVYLKAFCRYPFTDFIITTNGNVGLCCNDFLFQEVMGNVNKQSVIEIWNGDRFKFVRKKLLECDRSFSPLCSKCDSSFSYDEAHFFDPLNRFIFKYLIGIY